MMCRLHEGWSGNGVCRAVMCFCGILVIVTASGCWKRRPWTAGYRCGKASEEMFSSQVINGEAPRDRTPAQGLPGDLSSDIYGKYKHDMITDEDTGTESGNKSPQFIMDLNQ